MAYCNSRVHMCTRGVLECTRVYTRVRTRVCMAIFNIAIHVPGIAIAIINIAIPVVHVYYMLPTCRYCEYILQYTSILHATTQCICNMAILYCNTYCNTLQYVAYATVIKVYRYPRKLKITKLQNYNILKYFTTEKPKLQYFGKITKLPKT